MNPCDVYTSSHLDARAVAGRSSVRIRRVLQKIPNVYGTVEKGKCWLIMSFFSSRGNGNGRRLRWLIHYKCPSVRTRTRSVGIRHYGFQTGTLLVWYNFSLNRLGSNWVTVRSVRSDKRRARYPVFNVGLFPKICQSGSASSVRTCTDFERRHSFFGTFSYTLNNLRLHILYYTYNQCMVLYNKLLLFFFNFKYGT